MVKDTKTVTFSGSSKVMLRKAPGTRNGRKTATGYV